MSNDQQENLRVGYNAAVQLWTSEANMIWAKFGGMATAHAILLGTIGLALTATTPLKLVVAVLAIIGLVISIAWAAITRRSFNYMNYCIRYARWVEISHLPPLDLVQKGRKAARGEAIILATD